MWNLYLILHVVLFYFSLQQVLHVLIDIINISRSYRLTQDIKTRLRRDDHRIKRVTIITLEGNGLRRNIYTPHT